MGHTAPRNGPNGMAKQPVRAYRTGHIATHAQPGRNPLWHSGMASHDEAARNKQKIITHEAHQCLGRIT